MRILPDSSTEWSDVAFVPFKTYPIVMFFIAAVWSDELRGDPIIGFILLGYLVCLIIITWIAVLDAISGQPPTTYWRWSAAITVLGLMFSLKWSPTLAQ
jgi:hypothetical protein